MLCFKVSIAVSTVVNPFNTATNKPAPLAPGGGFGQEGDRLGISLDNLKDALSVPRQLLQVFTGNDLTLQSPDTGPTGATLSCDVQGGPYPGKANVHSVSGDKTAVLLWNIVTYVSPCNNYLLSNRWTPTVSVDTEGFSTRTIAGTARFRTDLLQYSGLTADSFRQWLIVPCSPTMRRVSVDYVTLSDDGAAWTTR